MVEVRGGGPVQGQLPHDLWSEVAHHLPKTIQKRELQVGAVETLAHLPRAGLYAEVGTGKTLMATMIALIKRKRHGNKTIVLMPPILLEQWKRWLDSLYGGITSLVYRGTPKQRLKLSFDFDFVLMSIQIFKADYERIFKAYSDRPVTLVVDEAVSIKNPGSQNHKAVREFING